MLFVRPDAHPQNFANLAILLDALRIFRVSRFGLGVLGVISAIIGCLKAFGKVQARKAHEQARRKRRSGSTSRRVK